MARVLEGVHRCLWFSESLIVNYILIVRFISPAELQELVLCLQNITAHFKKAKEETGFKSSKFISWAKPSSTLPIWWHSMSKSIELSWERLVAWPLVSNCSARFTTLTIQRYWIARWLLLAWPFFKYVDHPTMLSHENIMTPDGQPSLQRSMGDSSIPHYAIPSYSLWAPRCSTLPLTPHGLFSFPTVYISLFFIAYKRSNSVHARQGLPRWQFWRTWQYHTSVGSRDSIL